MRVPISSAPAAGPISPAHRCGSHLPSPSQPDPISSVHHSRVRSPQPTAAGPISPAHRSGSDLRSPAQRVQALQLTAAGPISSAQRSGSDLLSQPQRVRSPQPTAAGLISSAHRSGFNLLSPPQRVQSPQPTAGCESDLLSTRSLRVVVPASHLVVGLLVLPATLGAPVAALAVLSPALGRAAAGALFGGGAAAHAAVARVARRRLRVGRLLRSAHRPDLRRRPGREIGGGGRQGCRRMTFGYTKIWQQ